MISFNVGKTQVGLEFSFFAAVGIYAFLDRTGYAALFLLACLCHEGGHLLAMGISGLTPSKITFCGGGIRISGGFGNLFVLLSGCGANFLLAGVFMLCAYDMYLMLFAAANLLTGLLNLLPAGSFDGKRLLEAAAERRLTPEKTSKLLSAAEAVSSAAALTAAFFMLFTGKLNPSFVIAAVYLCALEIADKK